MKAILIPLVLMLLVIPSAQAVVNPLVTVFAFESAWSGYVVLNHAESEKPYIYSYHQYSDTWYLYIKSNPHDDPPYDNLTISVQCNDASSPTVFPTTFYQDWNDTGELVFSFPYGEDQIAITYNDHIIYGDVGWCDLSVTSHGGSFINNSLSYNYLEMKMIPLISSFEDLDCSNVDSATVGIATGLTSLVTYNADLWEIAWLFYSIMILILATFGVPILLFMAIRFAIYRITGHKILERRA